MRTQQNKPLFFYHNLFDNQNIDIEEPDATNRSNWLQIYLDLLKKPASIITVLNQQARQIVVAIVIHKAD